VVRVTAGGPEQLWLPARGDDLRSQFCAPTVLLCGVEHGQTWAAGQQRAGQLLDLEGAAVKGAGDWAPAPLQRIA
jgi:hypothetical protein